jgi:hypothetical protein
MFDDLCKMLFINFLNTLSSFNFFPFFRYVDTFIQIGIVWDNKKCLQMIWMEGGVIW